MCRSPPFLRYRQLFARLDQLLFSVAPLGRVPDDIGKADQFAIVVYRGELTDIRRR
jgi:hypothetical protein